ncbi:TetR/AcrR family transcriptional regulator [Edaphobacter modestus]|uniref:TetR family transcriptional regulator n=1 Tax=Edaphobacter modestus TaxID=388466 RepID=A0A4Q7Z1B5_9BACT|nr:TetR/AcrR family transcriptional regulator [Edaphobacter modestus]RZU43289.1 TetR family transcriptional regulator [Edaphobacter modestus]
MKTSAAKRTGRKPRADAQRNRERILEVAKQVFTRRGAEASMDEIAKRAKIGPGTLYRHFPTRDELLAAVYISEVEKLAEAQRKFSAELPPVEALRAWMLIFIDYIVAKKIIAPALNAMAGGPSPVFQQTNGLMEEAANALASRAIASRDLRPDVDPMDMLRAIYGVSSAGSTDDWPEKARQFVDILIQGSRP